VAGARRCVFDFLRDGRERGTCGQRDERGAGCGVAEGRGFADAFGGAGDEDGFSAEVGLGGRDEGVGVIVGGGGEV
jgi:hypothetical protein